MNIQQYIEKERQLYNDFASCVAVILESAISNASQMDGVQQIQCRAKKIDSLSRKLKDRGIYHSETIESEIKDLAGCRVIFYHNSDLNTFLNSSIVRDNFEVDWDETKIHYPDFDAQSSNDFYMGNHFVVSLKPERVKLPDFVKFADLRCEIQMQTLLNHAWSETTHDITYKKRNSKGFGDRVMAKIDERLMNIMKNYLRPAGYEFQKVKHDFSRLQAGREIFDQNITQLIAEVKDANELYDLLERYKDYVLPNYTDYSSFAAQIYSVVESSLERARQLGATPIDTPYGSFSGKDYKEILSVSLSILGFIGYLDFDRTLALLGEICKSHTEPAEQDIICECAVHFACYNDFVLRNHGYIVQQKLIDALSDKSDEDLFQISRYALASCESILTPNIKKTEWTYDQVALGTINLPGSTALAAIRSKALNLLERFAKKGDHLTRQSAFFCMEKATRTPHLGDYDDKLLHIVLTDTNSVIDAYTEDVDRLDFEMMQTNEERMSSHYRRAKQILGMSDKPAEVMEAARTTVDMVDQFRIKASTVPNYERYKVLVGFRSIFEKEWDDGKWSRQEKEKYRNEQIDIFIDSISDDNIDEWIKLFEICVKADSSDLATFQYFSKFLVAFAEKKPDLAKKALQERQSVLNKFLSNIIVGFSNIGRVDLIEEIARPFIAKGERLWECVRPFAVSPLTCRHILYEAKDRAIEIEDRIALYQIILSAIIYFKAEPSELHSLFIPAIDKLTELSDAGWINEAWFKEESIQFINALDRDIANKVLNNFIPLKQLDNHAEFLMRPIAEKYPDLVLDFFRNRLDLESKKDTGDSYDAIPYEFYELKAPLSAYPELMIDVAFSWYERSPELFQYRGGNLVSITFPEFNKKLEDKFLQLVQTREAAKLDFVTSILSNYKGETFLHAICREIIIAVGGKGPISHKVQIILEESDVLHGEFGFAEHCKQKIKEIEYWLSDTDQRIRDFAGNYIRSLDSRRAAEQRRAEEEVELRKHKYS